MNGYFNIIKPPGMTSHDLVAAVRRLTGERRAGHAGTLDPAAAGLMIIALGCGTRLTEYVLGRPKRYRAEIRLGLVTDTQDTTGEILSESDAGSVTEADAAAALQEFLGTYEQLPPMVSAVKVGGRPLYAFARQGIEVKRQPREVTIYEACLEAFYPGSHPRALIEVSCSKGTYIRTLCHDIGVRLGCGAAMSFLVRTGIGDTTLADACTIRDIAADRGQACLLPAAGMVEHLPRADLDADEAARLRHGAFLPMPGLTPGEYALFEDKTFVGMGVAAYEEGRIILRPRKVLPDESL